MGVQKTYSVINDEYINQGSNRQHFFSDRGTISEDDLRQFRLRCQILERYTSIRSLLYTAAKNGNELKSYLDSSSLYKKYHVVKPSTKKIVREGNRLALNFASAFKTLVEISTNDMKDDADELNQYKTFQSMLFDNVRGYRFWIRLRNYLVHRKMLYEGCSIADGSVILTCSASSLLEWQSWNAVQREDIGNLDGGNCLTTVLPAVFSSFLLIGEWATIQQKKFKEAASFLASFKMQYGITGELYIGNNQYADDGGGLELYYPPCYEVKNILSLIEWREFISQNGELAIFNNPKTLEELVPCFEGPFE